MPSGSDSTLQARKRVRYVLPKGCVIGGSYQIEKPLGHGGMGEVYLAKHMKLDIYRAIKILLPKIAVKNPVFATRFMREAKLAIQLQHPNIINVMDAEYDERLSIYYIVMEFVDGGNVRNLIRKNGPMAEEDVLQIVLKVGEALAVGEERQIVHRDIKPDNIMLTKDNVVKLADLGIAKDAGDTEGADVTSADVLIGTPAYVSPEQARDAQHVDSRADIYSLGVTMFEMLTGEKPYKGRSTVEIIQQLFEAQVPEVIQKNPAVSRKVSALVRQMMSKEKEKRPRNWKQFCKNVSRLLEEYANSSSSYNDTAVTTVEEFKVSMGGGVVLDSVNEKPLLDKKQLKKMAKYSGVALVGFIFCFLILGGVFSPGNLASLQTSFVLCAFDREDRALCEKHHLSPDLGLMFASKNIQHAWVLQHSPEEKKQDNPPPPPPPPEPSGYGTIHIKPKAPETVLQWLESQGGKIEISGKLAGTHSVSLNGRLEVPAGKHKLTVKIPGCPPQTFQEFELLKDATVELPVRILPPPGTVYIDCNAPDFQVWHKNNWVREKKIELPSLDNITIGIKAPGHVAREVAIFLQPGESKTVGITLRKIRRGTANENRMREARSAFSAKNYSTAQRLFSEEVKSNHTPEAMYMLGVLYRDHYRDWGWGTDKKKAYEYFSMAADYSYDEAFYDVGYFHENGLGGHTPSDEEALRRYKQGVAFENISCLLKVGEFYFEGKGGLKADLDTALSYFLRASKAAEDNSGVRKEINPLLIQQAHYNAGLIYEQKMLISALQSERDQHKKSARSCYEKAGNYKDAKERRRSL